MLTYVEWVVYRFDIILCLGEIIHQISTKQLESPKIRSSTGREAFVTSQNPIYYIIILLQFPIRILQAKRRSRLKNFES